MNFSIRFGLALFITIVAVFFCHVAHAEQLKNQTDKLTVLPILYGMNSFKVNGEEVTITRGLFPTDTASSRDLYTVLTHVETAWQWVREEGPMDKSSSLVVETWPHVHEDSIHTVRFMVPKEELTAGTLSKLYLLQARRPLEMGYVPTIATFKLFVMQRDSASGTPVFHEISTLVSQKKYCNADWALYRELGIPIRESEDEIPCGDE